MTLLAEVGVTFFLRAEVSCVGLLRLRVLGAGGNSKILKQQFELVVTHRIFEIWFAQNPHQARYLQLCKVLQTHLVNPSQKVLCRQYFYVGVALVLGDRQQDFFWLAKDVVNGPSVLDEKPSQVVKYLFGCVEHLLLADTVGLVGARTNIAGNLRALHLRVLRV